jgi:predicted nucleotidyltransferase
MAKARPSPFPFPPKRVYRGAHIPMPLIRRYASAIAAEFQPDKIILFGSYAHGTPHKDSDVDLLVIMPARNQHDQAVRIRWRLAAPFPVDLIVRTPEQMRWRIKEGESFLTTVVSLGKVLYEKGDEGVSQKGRAGSPEANILRLATSVKPHFVAFDKNRFLK